MTDTLPGILVIGQRRQPNGTFPPSGGSGGGRGDDGDPHQDELDPDGPGPDSPRPDPCANPETALPWNADAAAAAAAKEFARLAAARSPPENLNTREWGAYLYRNADGSVRIGPINYGLPFNADGNGTVRLIQDGPMSDVVGFVHSHNGGNHLPSDGNAAEPGDLQVLDRLVADSGNPSVLMYIVALTQGEAGHVPQVQTNVYDRTNARSSRDTFTPGPEVNPEALPCPS